jgi:CHAT domain-containing protein/tetratricopeptide (TPR) repeat protein
MSSHAQAARPSSTTGVLALVLLCTPVAGSGQQHVPQPEAPIELRAESSAAVDRHGAAERFEYRLVAAAENRYLIAVEQRGLDLVITITGPDGAERSYDSPLGRDEREHVLLEATVPGAYVVTIRSEEHTGAAGAHEVRARALELAARPELGGWVAITEGAAAAAAGRNDEALAAYADAAEHWLRLGSTREHAQTLYSVATLHYDRSDWTRSAELAAAAADLYAELGEDALRANARHLQAAALIETAVNIEHAPSVAIAPEAAAMFDEALRLFDEARAVQQRLGNGYDVGTIVNNIGLTHFYMGDLEQARSHWQQAVALFRDLDEWTAELKPLANQAVVDSEQGFLVSAIESFERIIEILPAGELQEFRARTLDNLGASQRIFGSFDEALRSHSAALGIHRERGDAIGEAYSLRGIGQAYYALGEFELATDYLERALTILEQANDGAGQLTALMYLGRIAYLVGDYDGALERHRLALSYTSSELDVAYVRGLLARDYWAVGDHSEARRVAELARATADALDERRLLGDALLALGRAETGLGNPIGAEAHLQQALSIYAALDLDGEQADVLNALARTAQASGELADAIRYGEASLEQIERLRGRVADPELRAFHAALRREYYHTQIDLLMTSHGASGSETLLREAFAVSERARSRMLVDLLTEAAIDLRQDMEPALLDRRRKLFERLAEARYRRDRLLDPASGSGPEAPIAATVGEMAATVGEMAAIETELNLIETDLRRGNPRYAGLSAPELLSADDVQQRLDPDTMLLQYSLGEARSYVWVVTRESIDAIELADRETIEGAARAAFESLRDFRSEAPARRQAAVELERLAELVLVPIAARLDRERLVVVADGALLYVPFGVLPAAPATDRARLIEQHEVVAVPSMSSLATLLDRASETSADRTLAVFADPVLEAVDPRLDVGALPSVGSADGSIAANRGPTLGRLPATGPEAAAIASLVPEDQRFIATGFAASRDAVLGADLSRYRLLHFATHGLVDARYPALSALVLSQFDESGRPRDGFLRLHDIYNLKLDADVVVLSACDTALGRSIRGEGLIGLAQGFMYAGARSLVASLWQVPDRATGELMARFYRHIFVDAATPGAALRRAQISMASERRWRDPYFWGAFVLVGDWD